MAALYVAGLAVFRPEGCLVPSSPEESALFRRLSGGDDTEEVLRLRLPGGSYRCAERRLFTSLFRAGLGLLLGASGGGESRPLLRLRRSKESLLPFLISARLLPLGSSASREGDLLGLGLLLSLLTERERDVGGEEERGL